MCVGGGPYQYAIYLNFSWRIILFHHVIAEPYSVREARIHLRRIKDLLSTNFHVNAYAAVDHLSLSFLSAVAGIDVEG